MQQNLVEIEIEHERKKINCIKLRLITTDYQLHFK